MRRKRRTRGGATLLCPKCRAPTRVLKTRRTARNVVTRERVCPSCDHPITSEERTSK